MLHMGHKLFQSRCSEIKMEPGTVGVPTFVMAGDQTAWRISSAVAG